MVYRATEDSIFCIIGLEVVISNCFAGSVGNLLHCTVHPVENSTLSSSLLR
jgi:hypothetical protein